jgi:subfamily B ATP-binding cassette protein MsbA
MEQASTISSTSKGTKLFWRNFAKMLRPRAVQIGVLFFTALGLAVLTASYGALAGPMLRGLFGGSSLVWPQSVAHLLPPPPDLKSLRTLLPFLIVGCALAKGIFQNRYTVWQAALVSKVEYDLRQQLHNHLLQCGPLVFYDYGVADLTSRTTHDVAVVGKLVGEGGVAILRDVLQVIALCSVCFLIDWQMSLIVFGIYPLAFWPIIGIGRRLRKAATQTHGRHADLSTVSDDHYRRSALVQLSASEAQADQRFERVNSKNMHARLREIRIRAWSTPITETLGAVALACGISYTMWRLDSHSVAPEHVMSFLATLLLLYQPLKGLSRIQGVLEPGRAALTRIESILWDKRLLPNSGTLAPPRPVRSIDLRGLSFARDGRPILTDIDFEFRSGEIHRIVGPNGSGKSTLAWLLTRMLEPNDGCISVDNIALESIQPNLWRGTIGWVTQDPLLGPGSIRENVLFGSNKIDDELLDRAASESGLHEVLARKNAGWAFRLGEHGAGLSGGEKQRVAICRALVRNPQVLIFDEPTAHLDRAGASELQRVIEALRTNRIIIVITHEESFFSDSTRNLDLGIRSGFEALSDDTQFTAS